MICFYCGKEISKEEKSLIIPLDIPYVNLPIHRPECINLINEIGQEEYIKNNIQRIYYYAGKAPTKKENNVKRK